MILRKTPSLGEMQKEAVAPKPERNKKSIGKAAEIMQPSTPPEPPIKEESPTDPPVEGPKRPAIPTVTLHPEEADFVLSIMENTTVPMRFAEFAGNIFHRLTRCSADAVALGILKVEK